MPVGCLILERNIPDIMMFHQNLLPNKLQHGHHSARLVRSSLASNGGGEVGAEHPENYKVKSFGFKKQEDRKKEERIKKEDEAFKEERKLNEGKKTHCQIDCQVMDTHLLDYPGAWRTDDHLLRHHHLCPADRRQQLQKSYRILDYADQEHLPPEGVYLLILISNLH